MIELPRRMLLSGLLAMPLIARRASLMAMPRRLVCPARQTWAAFWWESRDGGPWILKARRLDWPPIQSFDQPSEPGQLVAGFQVIRVDC